MGSTLTARFSDGTVISAWESFDLRDSFIDPLGSVTLRARPPRHLVKHYNKYIKKGEPIDVQVNGVPQCKLIIVDVNRTIDMNGVSFNLRAESVLTTPYEGHVDPNIAKKFESDTPAYITILEALAPYNFDDLCGDGVTNTGVMSGKPLGSSQTPVPLEELKHKQIEAQNNDTAYGFCSRILSRLGVVLRTDWEGKLLLSVPDYDQEIAYNLVSEIDVQSKPGDRMRNIQINESNKGQFSQIIVRGAASDSKTRKFAGKPVGKAEGVQIPRMREFLKRRGVADDKIDRLLDTEQTTVAYSHVEAVSPFVYQPEFPAYISPVACHKPMYHTDKKSRDKKWCESVAKLLYGLRAKSAFSIECDIDGLTSSTGRIWTVNTLAKVYIDILGIDSEMWIMERSLKSDMNSEVAHLVMIPKGALVLGEVPQ